jgi:chromosome partitioning protein
MPVVAVASVKGGCGKTTFAILVGAELALEGHKVVLLDCDLNQHGVAFANKAEIPGFQVIGNVDEHNVLSVLRTAEKEADLVIIDLPGVSSTLALKAFQRSHLVVVPSQTSLPDIRDAFKTINQIADAEELARSPIQRVIVWTRILPGFESRVSKHVRESAEGKGVPILTSGLMERAGFRELHVTGKVPRQIDPTGSSASNVASLTAELLQAMEPAEEGAV